MKYRSYDKYTHSGIMWINLVPEHWGIQKLKFIASCNDDVLGEEVDPDLSIHYVDIGSVSEGNIVVTEEISFSNAPSRARRLVRHGDIIISTVRTYLRAIAEINNPPNNMVVSTGFAVIRPQEIDRKYLAYALKSHSFVEWVVSESKGISYPAINASELMRLSVALPSREEQTAVATFLNHQTTQIDQLIEKKTRFIELIKEKRAALVTEAVTGKFDARTGKPYAEYKDSGVEWLGKVPAHWEVKPLKRGYSVKLGKMLQPVQQAPQDVLKPYLRASNIQPDGIYVSGVKEMWFSPLELGVLRLKYGDLLVSEGGDVGRSAIWRRELEEAYYQNSINRVRGLEGNNNYYLNYLLSCIKESGAIDVICNRLSIAHLTTEKLNEIQILFPTAEEQSAIAAFLDEKTTQVDQLIEKTQQSIDLLKEKRAALITAAVTGKIDVRNERI